MHAPPPGDDSEIGAAFAKPAEGHRLTPLMWDKLDCTPYGRFSKMMDKKVSDASAKTSESAGISDGTISERCRRASSTRYPGHG